jgi:hypothetical protein
MNDYEAGSRDRGLLMFFILSVLLTGIAFVSSLPQLPGAAFTGAPATPTHQVSSRPTAPPTPPAPSRAPTHAPAVPAPQWTPPPTPAPAASSGCGADPMAHVYRPSRLTLLNPCVTIAGTIADVRGQADGDYHVMLRVDPGQTCGGQNCLDDGDRILQQGYLVVEVVCERPVTQEAAIATCSQYHNNLAIPGVGSHVTVTGPWVHDQHGWNEIHPVVHFGR